MAEIDRNRAERHLDYILKNSKKKTNLCNIIKLTIGDVQKEELTNIKNELFDPSVKAIGGLSNLETIIIQKVY